MNLVYACILLWTTAAHFVMLNWISLCFLPNTIFILATSSHADEIGVRKYCKPASHDRAKHKMVMTKLATIKNSWTKTKIIERRHNTHTHSRYTKTNAYRKPSENVTCTLIQRNLIRIEQQLHSDFIHSTVSAHQFRYVLYLFFFISGFFIWGEKQHTHTHTQ